MSKQYLIQANLILEKHKQSDNKIKIAKIALDNVLLNRQGGAITDLVNNSTVQNIMNILAPFVTNYQIREVVKLLQQFLKDIKNSGRYFT